MDKKPIGIFDSGVGGLTVFREIRKVFPHEDIVYFGDTARVPYGPKSKNTVIEYSIQNARFLMQRSAKIILIACNTSSAVAIEQLSQLLPIPVIGVINPGAISAIDASTTGRIGIIGTDGTIQSKAYPKAISDISPSSKVFSKACPLFVSLAEEGWEDHQVTKIIAKEYLAEILSKNIDTLVLGCTHYPILKNTIKEIAGEKIILVDSAEALAKQLKEILPNPEKIGVGEDLFYVSDNETKFSEIASKILEKKITSLTKVKLGESWYV